MKHLRIASYEASKQLRVTVDSVAQPSMIANHIACPMMNEGLSERGLAPPRVFGLRIREPVPLLSGNIEVSQSDARILSFETWDPLTRLD